MYKSFSPVCFQNFDDLTLCPIIATLDCTLGLRIMYTHYGCTKHIGARSDEIFIKYHVTDSYFCFVFKFRI